MIVSTTHTCRIDTCADAKLAMQNARNVAVHLTLALHHEASVTLSGIWFAGCWTQSLALTDRLSSCMVCSVVHQPALGRQDEESTNMALHGHPGIVERIRHSG